MFLKNIFKKNDINANPQTNTEDKETFREELQTMSAEDMDLIRLQTAYRSGEIQEGELSQEQIDKLIALYDAQIVELQKTIEKKRESILKHKKRLKIAH